MGCAELLDLRGLDPRRAAARLRRPYSIDAYVERVRPIVEEVARRGYEAVKRYSMVFDGVAFDDPRVPDELARRAVGELDREALWALRVAVERARAFHEATMPRGGGGLEWKPLEVVAAYAPGGLKPYPSTVVSTVVPARVAGVERIVVLTPPRRGVWMVSPLVLAAAVLAGASEVYAVGGAQAVAGVAYGAAPLPRVDAVVGPGSPYVEAAKILVSHLVRVDCFAGPSEIVVVAGDGASPVEAAYDLLAQAEHGPLSLAVLLTPSPELARRVYSMVSDRVAAEHMGVVVAAVVDDLEAAASVVNELAPEHVELLGEAEQVEPLIRNAGAVAVGVPVAYTDYAAGPSHVLPTSGAARRCGGLTVYSFLKPVAVVRTVDREALRAAYVLARLEGFRFHAESLLLRLEGGADGVQGSRKA